MTYKFRIAVVTAPHRRSSLGIARRGTRTSRRPLGRSSWPQGAAHERPRPRHRPRRRRDARSAGAPPRRPHPAQARRRRRLRRQQQRTGGVDSGQRGRSSVRRHAGAVVDVGLRQVHGRRPDARGSRAVCSASAPSPASPARASASRSSTPASRRTRRWPTRSLPTSASSPAIRWSPMPFGHGTHVAGAIAGAASAAKASRSLYTGGIAPGAKLINVRVLGADGVGLTSDVIAGIDWAIAQPRALQHPRHQPVARPPGDGAGGHRSAVRGGRARRAAPASWSSRPRATTASLNDGSPILGGITSPGNSPLAITVGSLNTWGTAKRSDDTRGDLQLARPDALRSRREARHRRARQQDHLARGERFVPADDVSRPCTRRERAPTATCS